MWNKRGRKWDFSSQPLLSNARSAEFSSMKVTKLCYEKYFVLLSNHNVIGSKDLKLVSNWFERYEWSLVISVGKLFFCNWSSRHTVMLMMLFHLFLNTNCKWEPFPSLQPTCPLLFAFLKFLLIMASKKPKSPPKLRLSGHPVRNSVFVTIGNCKRPQIWILLICYTLVSSETCNCNVRIVITYYIDISIKRFYRPFED